MTHAWQSYECMRLYGSLPAIPVPDLLVLADKFAEHAQSCYATHSRTHEQKLWATRLKAILDDVEPRLAGASSHSVLPLVWQCLNVRALAVAGHLEDAIAICRKINRKDLQRVNERHFLRMRQTIMLVICHNEGAVAAIRYIVDELGVLQTYLPPTTRDYQKGLVADVSALRDTVEEIVKQIPHVEQVFESADYSRSEEWHRTAGTFLAHILCAGGFPLDAALVINALRSRHIDLPLADVMVVVKSLAKHKSFDVANSLFKATEPKGMPRVDLMLYHRTGLYLFARQGNIALANECFDKISSATRPQSADVGLLIHAYAYRGDTANALAVFHEHLSSGIIPLNIVHFSGIILAFAKHGDMTGMAQWIDKMSDAGFTPDSHTFSIVLQAYAERGDTSSVVSYLERMRNAGLPLSAHVSTSLISLFARKKDYRSAEEIFVRAVEEGIVPDQQMVTAVMNAHVEAGNWSGVIRAFDYLKHAASQKRFSLSIAVYNTLLKAYVLAGAPHAVVNSLYDNILDTGLKPDAFTYSLLIQSACDNGHMNRAVDLYKEMQQRASKGQTHLRVNVYTLTILMAGWLKKSNRKKAKETYDFMIEQGIQPTSVTFHHIIKAYSDQKSKESLQAALSFLKEIMGASRNKSWLSTPRTIYSGLDQVYGPFLAAYTRDKEPQKVEELLKEIEVQGGKPSIGTLTALLAAYCKVGDLDGAKRAWSRIFDLVNEPPDTEALIDSDKPNSRGYLVSIPLSIYTDALSLAGKHEEVASVWRNVRDAKFTADADNWNRLAIALVRAGEVSRAFDVLQKLLLPKQRHTLALRGRTTPTSPLTLDASSDSFLTGSEGRSRDKARRRSNILLERRRLNYIMAQLKLSPDDTAAPLHAMYRISPAWSNWAAYPQTLEHLRVAYDALVKDRQINWVPPGGGEPVAHPGKRLGKDFFTNRGLARLALQHITERCPDALALVRRWKNRLARFEPAELRQAMRGLLWSQTSRASQVATAAGAGPATGRLSGRVDRSRRRRKPASAFRRADPDVENQRFVPDAVAWRLQPSREFSPNELSGEDGEGR
jgi:pentatricopeptide repeat-containing protein PET309